MSCSPESCLNVLLIDDDPNELTVIVRVLNALTKAPFCVHHVEKCSEAVRNINTHSYDLILLDNYLSPSISAEFSVPFIRSAFHQAIVAIISNDISGDFLSDPKQIGVDYVVDKAEMIGFLRDQVEAHILVKNDPNAPYARRQAG